MNINYAYRVAISYDFNRDGYIKSRGFGKEIAFDSQARMLTDRNKDGHISVDEFAHTLAEDRIYVGYDKKVHARTPYGYPGGPYYPAPPVTYPGPGYGYPGGGYGYGYGYPNGLGNIAAGAAVGGAIGYIADGKNGLGKGAVIGGVIGAIGNLFQ